MPFETYGDTRISWTSYQGIWTPTSSATDMHKSVTDVCKHETSGNAVTSIIYRDQPLSASVIYPEFGTDSTGYAGALTVSYDNWVAGHATDSTACEIGGGLYTLPSDPRIQKWRKMPSQMPAPRRARSSLLRPTRSNEEKARQLLLRMIGPARFSRYVRDGFISVRGRSGKVYQVFPGERHTRVWEPTPQGWRNLEDLCVCVKDHEVPPTDSVVVRMLMIDHSEEEFRARCRSWPGRHIEKEGAA